MAAAEANPTGPVVVGTDGSEASVNALLRAVQEAEWRDVDLHVVHVLNVTPAVLHLSGDQTMTTRELAESDRSEIWKLAQPVIDGAGVEVVRIERDGEPGKALLAYAEEVGASVVVVGPRGRGRVEKMFLGSTAEEVVKSATCDVLVVKSRP